MTAFSRPVQLPPGEGTERFRCGSDIVDRWADYPFGFRQETWHCGGACIILRREGRGLLHLKHPQRRPRRRRRKLVRTQRA